MTREELLAPIVESIARETGLARDKILESLADWECVPGYKDGRHEATAILKGTEIHFAFVDERGPRVCTRGSLKAFLAPLLERRGFLTTRVLNSNLDQMKFVKRVGFKPTWNNGTYEFYLLGHLPFERKNNVREESSA